MRSANGIALATALLLSSRGTAGPIDNHYAQWRLGQPYGYRDLKIVPGRWKIRGLSMHAGTSFTIMVALHRAAIHAKAEQFARFYAVSLKSTSDGSNEEVDLVAVGISGEQIPTCEEKRDWAPNCQVYSVDALLSKAGAALNLSVAQQNSEVAALDGNMTRK